MHGTSLDRPRTSLYSADLDFGDGVGGGTSLDRPRTSLYSADLGLWDIPVQCSFVDGVDGTSQT